MLHILLFTKWLRWLATQAPAWITLLKEGIRNDTLGSTQEGSRDALMMARGQLRIRQLQGSPNDPLSRRGLIMTNANIYAF